MLALRMSMCMMCGFARFSAIQPNRAVMLQAGRICHAARCGSDGKRAESRTAFRFYFETRGNKVWNRMLLCESKT